MSQHHTVRGAGFAVDMPDAFIVWQLVVGKEPSTDFTAGNLCRMVCQLFDLFLGNSIAVKGSGFQFIAVIGCQNIRHRQVQKLVIHCPLLGVIQLTIPCLYKFLGVQCSGQMIVAGKDCLQRHGAIQVSG